jgi:Tol biopolymer transport system component
MSCSHIVPWARPAAALAVLGSIGLWGCDDQSVKAPTEPFDQSAVPAQAVSKKLQIAFSSDRDGGASEIYVMQANGKKQTRLTNNTDYDFRPAWSPDRSRIAFTNLPQGGVDGNIFAMNADGTGLVQLTNDPIYEDFADWSPDGSKIAFSRDGQIIVMNADGSNQTPVPHELNDNDSDPDWSPDGTRFVFTRERERSQIDNIWVMNIDGSGSVHLTETDFQAAGASWSPDGSKIAFISNRSTGRYQIWVMNADGSGQTAIPVSVQPNSAPTWSLDGSKLTFSAFGSTGEDIFVVNTDGSGLTQLTNDPAPDGTPAWAR